VFILVSTLAGYAIRNDAYALSVASCASQVWRMMIAVSVEELAWKRFSQSL
jgi:hypothetical protein